MHAPTISMRAQSAQQTEQREVTNLTFDAHQTGHGDEMNRITQGGGLCDAGKQVLGVLCHVDILFLASEQNSKPWSLKMFRDAIAAILTECSRFP